MRHLVALCLALVVGCADGPTLGDGEQAVRTTNGTSLNGTKLNGTSLNGTKLNGTSLNGTKLNGTKLNGTSLDGATLTGTSGTPPTAGADAVGSTWIAVLPASTTAAAENLALRIDTADAGTGANADLWFYRVSYQAAEGWLPLCGTDEHGTPIQAVAVAGVWKPVTGDAAHYTASTTDFTWACRGKSIAKCVEMGYKPWRGYVDHLTSCVRLLRGDYCGSGNAYTVDGTLLNLYDNVGIELDTEAWNVEAEWGPDGAVCVNKYNAARYDLVLTSDPKCVKSVKTSTCGRTFLTGAYLIDELP